MIEVHIYGVSIGVKKLYIAYNKGIILHNWIIKCFWTKGVLKSTWQDESLDHLDIDPNHFSIFVTWRNIERKKNSV